MYSKIGTYETTTDTANSRTLCRMKITPLQDNVLNYTMREQLAREHAKYRYVTTAKIPSESMYRLGTLFHCPVGRPRNLI
jgi:hypothetical protein